MNASTLLIFAVSTALGFALSRVGSGDFDAVASMFLCRSAHLYALYAVAVGLTAPALHLLSRTGRTLAGDPIRLAAHPQHGGSIPGGILFGIGWALTGLSPALILVGIGEGKPHALAALTGALTGTWLVGRFYHRLQSLLGLPPLTVGTGTG